MASISDTNNQRPRREKIDPARIEFRRLSESCQRGAFSCGYVHIDDFFRRLALEAHLDLRSRTVSAHLDGGDAPVGFYAMAISAERAEQFSEHQTFFERLTGRLTRYTNQLTTVELIWVAVESSMQRCGIGTLLMGKALDDFYEIVDRTGIAALTLTPIDTNAATFYATLGFVPYGSRQPQGMFLPAEAVIALKASNVSDMPEAN